MLKEVMLEKANKYIDIIYHNLFIQGIVETNIDPKAICHYLQEDYAYLDKFLDKYALCLTKANSKDDKRFFINQISAILDYEMGEAEEPHQTLAKYTGQSYQSIISGSQWCPSFDHYIKHM